MGFRLLIVALSLLAFSLLIFYGIWPREASKTSTLTYLGELGSTDCARIYILVDNNRYDGFSSPWGLSLLVETSDLMILFDAGPGPDAIKRNSKLLNLNLSDLDFIIISHEHGDHIGGLNYIAEIAGRVPVYVPSHLSAGSKNMINRLGLKTVEISETTILAEGIAVVGELRGPPWEQALAVNIRGLGLVILVGCSHPGVDRLVAKASSELGVKPFAVIGGFHLAGASEHEIRNIIEDLRALGVKKIYPIHCSGSLIKTILQEEYPDMYGDGHVGAIVTFESP